MNALHALERFARRRPATAVCDVCAGPIADAHRHVADTTERRLCCACIACAASFERATSGRFRTVPTEVRTDTTAIAAERWRAIGIPVGLAFVMRSSSLGRWLAILPSPAGPTEAEIADDAWSALADESPLAASIVEDVEALLIRTHRDDRREAFAVPIDACYELVAILRARWKGFDGGDEARDAIDRFMRGLAERAHTISGSES